MIIIYDQRFLDHYPPYGTHMESPLRLKRALDALNRLGLAEKVKIVGVNEPDYTLPTIAHSINYVKFIEESCKEPGYLDSDTYINENTFKVAALALTASVSAHKHVVSMREPVFVLARPPGHHAGFNGRAMGAISLGFCIFNNVAVLARHILQNNIRRILILDIDLHHGNGTQDIFWYDPNVMHIDIHQIGIYPGTGYVNDLGGGEALGTKVNIPVKPGARDNLYDAIYEEIVKPLLEEWKPEYILISAGFDAYYRDPFSDLNITSNTFYEYFRKLRDYAKEKINGRLIAVLEGGYREGLEKALPNSIAALMGMERVIKEEKTVDESARSFEVIAHVKRVLRDYWKIG